MKGDHPSSNLSSDLNILELRANAELLIERLERDLRLLLDHPHRFHQVREIYDSVYLPRTVGIAACLSGAGIPDIELLEGRLNNEMPAVHMDAVIDLLRGIVVMLSPHQ